MSLFKRLADWEEARFNDLVERVAERHPDHFWDSAPIKGLAPDARFLKYWPHFLTIGYWYYIFGNLEKGHWGGYHAERWLNLPDWGEWRYLFRQWDGKKGTYVWSFDPKWTWIQLTQETKGERVLCRFRGHPKGEVYWNPGGDEPDHHCNTCGENIG